MCSLLGTVICKIETFVFCFKYDWLQWKYSWHSWIIRFCTQTTLSLLTWWKYISNRLQNILLCYCQREASIAILLLVHTSYDQTGHIPQVFLSEDFSTAQQESITKTFVLNLYSKEHLFCAYALLFSMAAYNEIHHECCLSIFS